MAETEPSTVSKIALERYVSFTTFTRDGRPKASPVWIADLGDGTLGFTTSSASYKVKRLANDDRCTLQPCDGKGTVRPGTVPVAATAVVSSAAFPNVTARVRAKYGIQYRMITMFTKMGQLIRKESATETAVVITLDSAADGA